MAKSSHVWKRGAVYYFRAVIQGKLISRAIGPVSKEAAVRIARDLFRSEHEKRWAILEQNKLKDTFASLGDLFAAYRAAAKLKGEPQPSTVEGNIWAVSRIVRTQAGAEAAVDALSTSILSEQLVEGFLDSMLAGKVGDMLLEDRARRTVRSTLLQARSLFAKPMRKSYRHLCLPDLAGFLEADVGKTPMKRYQLPPKTLRVRTAAEGAALKVKAPNLYAAYLLCYHLGLRSSEAVMARWDWIETTEQGKHYIHIIRRPAEGFSPKGYEGTVPVPEAVWHDLQFLRNSADPYILPGGAKTNRKNLIGRELSAWMRGIGWDKETYPKAAHELRKLIGSMWYKRFGVEGARERLRHANMQTTLDYYAHLDYEEMQALEVEAVA